MQPSHSHKKTYLQTQLTDPSKPAPFDHAKQMNAMSQKRWNKTDKQKDVVAYQTQLYKTNVQLHGHRHFNAAIEQHAGTPSSIIAKAHDAVKLQADPKCNLSSEKPSPSQLPLVQPQPSGIHNLSGCGINNHTMSPLCSMLKDCTPPLALNLSNNQIGESGMKVLTLGPPR